jgi:protein involved in polysaccharide export with SLBB domain
MVFLLRAYTYPRIFCCGRRWRPPQTVTIPELAVTVAQGVSDGFKPPKYLKPGDVVRVEIDGIGTLENPVR